MDKIINIIGVIILGLLISWLVSATKRDIQRKKNRKK